MVLYTVQCPLSRSSRTSAIYRRPPSPGIAYGGLNGFFRGGYVPSLSINYVGMSEDMGERLSQLYYIKTPLRVLFIFVFLCTRRFFF